jgi:FkbM family methyltransferase
VRELAGLATSLFKEMESLKQICMQSGFTFHPERGTLVIPEGIRHVKLDIGLGESATNSERLLRGESDSFVIGIDPNPIAIVKNLEQFSSHIGSRYRILPIALGTQPFHIQKLYITGNDSGCSSLYRPSSSFQATYDRPVTAELNVPCATLEEFLSLFPFEQITTIDYIKVDAQGSDLDIIKGAGDFLERVVWVTMEADGWAYEGATATVEAMDEYMSSKGFKRVAHPNTSDPTYVNERFSEEVTSKIFIAQR